MIGTLVKTRPQVSRVLFSAGVAALACFQFSANLFAAGPTESILYNFTGQSDGARPNGFVIFDTAGALYGTTLWGGTSGLGAVFKLTPGANGYTERVLYSFTGGADGARPASGLVMDASGSLYGTAEQSNGGQLAGVVFKLTPPVSPATKWTYTVIYGFTGGVDGGLPNCSLVFDQTGALFGTTTKGGAFGQGTIFKLTPPVAVGSPWTETVLYSFTGGADGAIPFSPVLLDGNGNLFGTTVRGGASNFGTVFELATTSTPGNYILTTLHSFTNGSDGAFPYAGLVSDSSPDATLYGTTFGGGTDGYGVAFRLKAPAQSGGAWTETVIHTFTTADGSNLASGLAYLPSTSSFYGTTFSVTGTGVVFSLTKPTSVGSGFTYNVLHTFAGTPDGTNPLAPITFDSAGNLYSTTFLGGSFNSGTVFELSKGTVQ